ncbi:CoA transferase [Methylobacterium frigidaeris]|uniref:Formyl-CoA:oxalate CoA-transferase n=1 Tax=Methylobacterium frigidaeris TaxID=2038277 RepID=A0AA37HBW1_9HYPH|nr:CoA transferase [Methylobacterium frigidaeris]PIK73921.1 acyl-CoA transferase [Methylobacterium frigidaeris]GJD62719.1 Formyl-CoA:oxalate CoA-transferase [Methylobacterium frigidaeris]
MTFEAGSPAFAAILDTIRGALGAEATPPVRVTGAGALPSRYPVSDLAAASVAAAGLALAELVEARFRRRPGVTVDRRLAAFWFARSLHPQGWDLPPLWDPVAGDYRAADGWIRLHTNAPHHRDAALSVLGAPPERDAVAQAVARWRADDLENAVVAAGGCAAAMRSAGAWAAHPQGEAVAREPLIAWEAGGAGEPGLSGARPDRPLAGLRVLDLTRVLAGPVATRVLAGFGATVLRLDPPGWEEPGVVPEMTLGKTCARLDLKEPAGRARFEALLAGADVLVHGYRSDALAHLGLDAEVRARLRPGLIDISLDAYGWTGPWRARRGFDSLVQMSSGLAEAGMASAGAGRPVPLPVQALDHATGYLMAAASLHGLTQRLATGRGGTARLSLARTAVLLAAAPAPLPEEAPAALGRSDFAEGPEPTGWGPALRLRPPLTLDGVPMRWDRAAGPLGAAAPAW